MTALLPGGESMGKSANSELGNIALSSFLDGWANYLETGIDMTPLRYIEPDGSLRVRAVDGFERIHVGPNLRVDAVASIEYHS